MEKAKLVLEDGSVFEGFSFGHKVSACGEVVFTTAMSGYPESLSDPSFCGQILVCTYPLIGNYGIHLQPKINKPFYDENGIPIDFESDKIQVSGLVVAENCEEPSHFACTHTLAQWLQLNEKPAICGIDTRSLTKKLREDGLMRGKIVVDGTEDIDINKDIVRNPVTGVSCANPIVYKGASCRTKSKTGKTLRIALVDCGAKANILRCLLERGTEVIRLPWDYDISSVEYDGLFLSNGPGDPKACGKTIANLRRAFERNKPIFGICLGAQIMALAAGGDTYKLPYGHRAVNQPCIDLESGRCYITSQNHGYAVREQSLPRLWESWFVNANDGTCEGIKSKTAPFSAVQFHPEGCPGPRDTEFLIDRFLDQVGS
ncbi:MAG: glutamine-hydrolyzing carbamoyl-phosphate synthase small subunit [Termitinemataceae bacterium]|nr:MAG: glutamine-hydrolyzing carbamoyl-phosphate synthase small subunit [Termitinemataceae bacterium]